MKSSDIALAAMGPGIFVMLYYPLKWLGWTETGALIIASHAAILLWAWAIYQQEQKNSSSLKPWIIGFVVLLAMYRGGEILYDWVDRQMGIGSLEDIIDDVKNWASIALFGAFFGWCFYCLVKEGVSKLKKPKHSPFLGVPSAPNVAKFLVADRDQIQGSFTLREICQGINDGSLSRMITVFKDGEWRQPHEVGVVYAYPNAAPAPGWAG